ncbi:N-acetylmuramoyl-L-alanine amidase [candidate division KSB1 bacterium]|nr:N-acetylmuramoyl-L-alanine amidase [candidate division KSB1 bacterium]RQW09451.1 MAG: N-acetylmuramoyl-L-alanine amidase [candidate division KSB1 bacterium]
MIRLYGCLLLLLVVPAMIVAADIEITVIYPAENDTIDAAAIDSNFIFGQVTPVQAQLYINGRSVSLHKSGGFLAFLPIAHGDFIYSCRAVSAGDSAALERTVHYTPLRAMATDSVAIDFDSVLPHSDLELRAGDVVDVSFRGTPACRATFSIDGIVADAPMSHEDDAGLLHWAEAVFGQGEVRRTDVAGLYRGSYFIQCADTAVQVSIHCQLIDPAGDTARVTLPGTLSIDKTGLPRMAETALDLTVLRTGPRKSYYYFLPRGVKLQLSGRQGRNYRIRLSDAEEAWVEDHKIRLLPLGTPAPHQHIELVRTRDAGAYTRASIYCSQRAPYRIVQSVAPNALKVLLYGVTADTDWIRYDFNDPLIRDIRWQQVGPHVYELTIDLQQKHPWGYEASYVENQLCIDIKKTPAIGKRKRSALRDVTVLLDPGHAPDTGAVGPTGYTEQEANLLLSRALAEKLRDRGARVKFTRAEEGLSLADRFDLAMNTEADILLSLHHNAIPAGVNPFKSRGSSTYYYHPQSRELARTIHRHMLRELGLPDFGLYWDNLAMCRPTRMPAVLIEPAFMMHPEEEAKIRSSEFRAACADAIVDGVVEFLLKNRE